MRSLLTTRHLDRLDVEAILGRAVELKAEVVAGREVLCKSKKTVGLLFFEDSTRTRVSFEQAAYFLGHKSVGFSASSSSINKGETLKDTVLTLKNHGLDALVIRHPMAGSCGLALRHFERPVINAGDGKHEHPTQALGDAMTILQRKGRVEGLVVAIVGDVLHSRVARSNLWLLTKLGAEVRLIGPRILMPSDLSKFPAKVYYDLGPGLQGADVVMALRLQRERMESGLVSVGAFRRGYQISRSAMRLAKPDAIVMHPGPMNRGVEINDATADGPSSAIGDQVANSVFVRMAVLDWALGGTA